MRCVEDPDPIAFAREVWPLLMADPCRTSIIATTVSRQIHHPASTTAADRWLRIDDGGELAGVAIMTGGYGVCLSPMPAPAAAAVAAYVAAARPAMVNGPVAATAAFVESFTRTAGLPARPAMASRLLTLNDVIFPTRPTPLPGLGRPATPADRPALIEWQLAFAREAMPDLPPTDPGPGIDERLATGELIWLWEYGDRLVSFAYRSEIGDPATFGTPVIRISGVYTPPDLRGYGYASALVATMSQYALDAGASACMLYTDAANPISNKIYERIGYRMLDEATGWKLG